MTSYRQFISCLLFACVLALIAVNPACAATPFYWFPVEIRKDIGSGWQDYTVYVRGTYTEYANGEDCGNPDHKTRKNAPSGLAKDRCFSHIHGINFEFPDANGVPLIGYRLANPNGQLPNLSNPNLQPIDTILFTVEDVNAYWHPRDGVGLYVPLQVSYQGGATPKTNCWGYAFGYNDIWIQDPTYIYTNDYESLQHDPEVGGVVRMPGHVTKVTSIVTPPYGHNGKSYVNGTIGKNRSSGICSKSWSAWNWYLQPSEECYQKKP